MSTYDSFISRVKEIALLNSVRGALQWDMETFLPRKGVAHRADQLALLSGIVHDLSTNRILGEWLETLKTDDSLDEDQRSNVRETARQYERDRKLPKRLVEELSRATTEAHDAWVDARRRNDFATFLPHLERIVALKREVADHVGFDAEPYDALLDEYEPGLTAASVEAWFTPLRDGIIRVLDAVLGAPVRPDTTILRRSLDIEKQRAFAIRVASDIGFDFEAGRLDVSAHPFCSAAHPCDVRLTTRYDEDDPLSSFFSVLHETGHGLYEQGLDLRHANTPRGFATSLGIHESQSRTWENLIGRSRAFWERYLPALHGLFEGRFDDVSVDAFHFAVNAAQPSFIRVEADELTYNLHVMLRFELERELVNGRLAPRDLPQAWNALSERYLGIRPPSDEKGVLQDVHWSAGLIGYFPTYTLGNLFAAQFFDRLRRDVPELESRVREGRFAEILGWMRERIHAYGMRYRSAELVQQVTGEPPKGVYLAEYLEAKYRALYRI
jgi:carboxypeptidase Taq